MAQRVAILGANGVYARHLIPRLVAGCYEVTALVRRPESATMARACGADIDVADIFDRQSMIDALADCDIGINLATSLPGPSGRGTFDANDRLRSEGSANWMDACRAAGVGRVIQQSIAMVNGVGGALWSDEDSIFADHDDSVAARAIAASLTMEAAIEASNLDWIILRGGLFYGPGTGFDDGWHALAAAGKLRLPGDGSDYVSLCHIADMADATLAALSVWPSRKKLAICDDEPAQWRDIFGFVASLAGQPAPEPGGRAGFKSFRISNSRAKRLLGWSPRYASWRTGLAR